ncbi:very long chain fatty acid elongase 7-like [Calliopsis andreniformis]|uniref:very long chain fatty acid elongase 7-like n=1 Tax=Calliopsis andreniformis TaxID=337506 RepID=UPI003FCD0A01
MWYSFLVKYLDFIETILFVLRKKKRQISTLHLYHHVSTVLLTWLYTKYWAHGMSLTVVGLNDSIHVIMYTFYLLSSYGPTVQKYLQPIKPFITIIQMVQFLILIGLGMQPFFKPECQEHVIPTSIMIVNLSINFALFYKFYRETYTSNNRKTK